jgi:LPS O-antigen subunit length determinant protein (WzzB/FepE family)
VTPSKTLLRSTVDRLLRPHFDQLTDGLTAEVRSLQAKIDATSVEIRSEVNETTTRELADRLATMSVEIRSEVNETTKRELADRLATMSVEIRSEVNETTKRELADRLATVSVEIRSEVNETTKRELADRLATMSVEIRSEVNGTVIREISALTAELSAKFSAEMDALRADYVELTRMFRMQGDAADQVAEALGRTLTRLTAELESFGGGLEELEEHLETDHADHGRSEGATSHS